MRSSIRPLAVSAALLLISTAPGFALGIRLMHQDPEAVARGNAFTATADNPSAIYYNPAGITQLEGSQFQIGGYGLIFDSRVESAADGATYDTPDIAQGIAHLFLTCKIPDTRFSFGVGIYSPYGLASEYDDNTPFRSLATKSKLTYLALNPVVAMEVTKTFSVAVGLTVNYAKADLRRGIIAQGDEFKFEGDGMGVGFNAGLLWQPTAQHSFGLTYRSATTIDFEGDVQIKSATPFFFPSSKELASAEFDFPQQVVAGYSFRPTPRWNFEVDVDWTDWRSVGTITIEKDSGNVLDIFEWRSQFSALVGATRSLSDHLNLSAGYMYVPSATPDANYHPSVADVDLHFLSLGVDYHTDRWRVGLTYNFAYGEDHTVTGSAPSPIGETADGNYRFNGHGIAFALGGTF